MSNDELGFIVPGGTFYVQGEMMAANLWVEDGEVRLVLGEGAIDNFYPSVVAAFTKEQAQVLQRALLACVNLIEQGKQTPDEAA
ncbi:MAG: hypothetical protein WC096_07720 [Sphaerochaetaceae bacterium]|jgi:hypothetical protein